MDGFTTELIIDGQWVAATGERRSTSVNPARPDEVVKTPRASTGFSTTPCGCAGHNRSALDVSG